MATSEQHACGTCQHWRRIPGKNDGMCVWLMNRPKPYWLADTKLTHQEWGTACAAFEETQP